MHNMNKIGRLNQDLKSCRSLKMKRAHRISFIRRSVLDSDAIDSNLSAQAQGIAQVRLRRMVHPLILKKR